MDSEQRPSGRFRRRIRTEVPREIPWADDDSYEPRNGRVVLNDDGARLTILLSPAFRNYMVEWHQRIPAMLDTGIPCLPVMEEGGEIPDFRQFHDYFKALSQTEGYEKMATVAQSLLEKVDTLDLPDDMRGQLYSGIGKTRNTQDLKKAEFVVDLMHTANLKGELAVEVLKGAHVAIKDGGRLHAVLSRNRSTDDVVSIAGKPLYGRKSLRKRASSHYWTPEEKFRRASPLLEVSFQAPHVFPEMMVGKRKHNNYSWFQLERSPLMSIGPRWVPSLPLSGDHNDDYKEYRQRGKNIGPYGLSEHVDRNPLIVHLEPEFHEKVFARKKEHDIKEPCRVVPQLMQTTEYARITERARTMNFSNRDPAAGHER